MASFTETQPTENRAPAEQELITHTITHNKHAHIHVAGDSLACLTFEQQFVKRLGPISQRLQTN